MTNYFLDSSALIKRYLIEVGTPWMRSVVDRKAQNIILIAQITQSEVVSAVTLRNRNGTISARTAHAMRLLIDRHVKRQYRVVSLTEEVIRRSKDLLELHPSRAYDAVQLASALEINSR